MQPTLAENGPAALEILEEAARTAEPYALLLSDVHMPGMDGFGLVERIRRNADYDQVKIVVLTSADGAGEGERSRNLGVAEHLVKPVRHTALLRTILRIFGQQTPPEPLPAPRSRLASPAVRPLHILLAEDNEINRTMALNLLERWGHRVKAANTGRAVLSLVEDEAFDVILMDLQMPEMDGFQTTAAIREKEKSTGDHVPIFAMTAHALQGDRERCLAAGMDGYIAKPIRSAELQAALNGVETCHMKPAPAKENSKDQEVLNRAALVEYVDGDEELLRQIVQRFLKNGPAMLEQIRQALVQGNAQALAFHAHTLKGALGNFFAQPAYEAARRLEMLGRQDDLAAAPSALDTLDHEIDRLRQTLVGFMQEQPV
jgi:CheY-like chemotaxis protein